MDETGGTVNDLILSGCLELANEHLPSATHGGTRANLGFAHGVLFPHAILEIHARVNKVSLKKADKILDEIERTRDDAAQGRSG